MGKFIKLESYKGKPVINEPGLEDCERETAFYFSARDAKNGIIRVSSNHAPIVRGLLKHKDYVPEEITAIKHNFRDKIIYTAGRLPMNCLRITSSTGSMSVGKVITQSARCDQSASTDRSSDKTPDEEPETPDVEKIASKQAVAL